MSRSKRKGKDATPTFKPLKGNLCWWCSRQLYVNSCKRVLVDGHVRETHATCAEGLAKNRDPFDKLFDAPNYKEEDDT